MVGTCRDEDMEVNPAKEKKLSNVRTVQADEKVRGGMRRNEEV
jgi:predicted membrane GTPase involved in stress response